MVRPCRSASTWISTCFEPVKRRSRYTRPSPNAAMASRRAPFADSIKSSGAWTARMPFPPPPEDAFSSSGYPTRCEAASMAARASASSSCSISSPGITGTPAARMVIRAVILSPICSMASGLGPTHCRPAFPTARAKSARSERKPKPGWMASAPVDFAIAKICSWSR